MLAVNMFRAQNSLHIYALATPRPSHSRFRHIPHTSSNPSTTFAHARFASRSFNRRSQSPRSIYVRPSSVFSFSRFHSCSCSLHVRNLLAAFAVVWRDMWSVSDTLARCCSSSRVDIVRCESATSGSVEACGSNSRVDWMRGRRFSMSSESRGVGRGPEKDAVREVRLRDWWVRWVVRASCAVFSLMCC